MQVERAMSPVKIGCGPYLESVLVLYDLGSPIIDSHGALRKSVFLLKGGVHEEDRLAMFGRALLKSLFKQISCALDFLAALRRSP